MFLLLLYKTELRLNPNNFDEVSKELGTAELNHSENFSGTTFS